MSKEQTTSNSLGCGTVLFFIFLVLKLCNVITWSWWWVTAPLWVMPVFLILLFIIAAIWVVIEEL